MPPRTSVIIPIRNGVHEIAALAARLDLMGTDQMEVLVVDDGSTDGTGAALRAAAQDRPYIRVIEGQGTGVAAARNLALSQAIGEYVWFADCDDQWEPTIVAELVLACESNAADVVICNAAKLHESSNVTSLIEDAPSAGLLSAEQLMRLVLRGQIQGHLWNKLFRRSVLGEDPFPQTRAHSDLGGILGIIPRVGLGALLPRTLYTYKVHAGSILNSGSYHWGDLVDCWEVAKIALPQVGIEKSDADARLFVCKRVALPLVNESIRRQDSLTSAERVEVWARTRSLFTVRDLVRLATHRSPRPALQLAAFRLLPAWYAGFYSWYRRRRWSGIDTFRTD